MSAFYYTANTEKMILRDYPALDRTHPANERTLPAYIRTALTLFIGRSSFIQFFINPLLIFITGWIFLPLVLSWLSWAAEIYPPEKAAGSTKLSIHIIKR